MDRPIRIGGLCINLSNLCYAREGKDGELNLFMNCGLLVLRGSEAALVRSLLLDSAVKVGASPQLPKMAEKGQIRGRLAHSWSAEHD